MSMSQRYTPHLVPVLEKWKSRDVAQLSPRSQRAEGARLAEDSGVQKELSPDTKRRIAELRALGPTPPKFSRRSTATAIDSPQADGPLRDPSPVPYEGSLVAAFEKFTS